MAFISSLTALLPEPEFASENIFTPVIKKSLRSEDREAYLKSLLKDGQLEADKEPALYIYQVQEKDHQQIGIWAQVRPEDIKIHEHILTEKVARIRKFRLETGVESKPVLLTYRPSAEIKKLIEAITAVPATKTYANGYKIHRLWRITDLDTLRNAFANIPALYMADGHHRLVANPFKTLSALLMDTDEILVKPYHRLITADWPLVTAAFDIIEATGPVLPCRKGHFGLLKDDKWYELVAKVSEPYDTETLSAVFDHVEYTPDLTGEPGKLLFTLNPLSIDEVMTAADEGIILPPKSTWIEPKIPFGLLMCRHII